jgi:ligand-binding sensor domain-containing protein
MHKYLTIFLLSIILAFNPVSAELIQFWPDTNSISTADIRDICDGKNGRIILATLNGISIYDNQDWKILHALPRDGQGYLDGIPLNDDVFELEYDYLDNLWIGYGNGIQIYNGYSKPVTIKEMDGTLSAVTINKLKRQGRIMWIATGDLGINYYFNGKFEWVKPGEETGLNGNHITDMEVDYSNDNLYVASASNGQYVYSGGMKGLENITFKNIVDPIVAKDMTEIASYPLGGAVFFNDTDAVYYNEFSGAKHVFNVRDLSGNTKIIFDISVTNSGRYVIGTDNGIFCWYKGEVCRHLTKFDGLSDYAVKKVYIDDLGRWWFTTKYAAGYYFEPEFTAVSSIEISPDSFESGSTIINNVITEI